MMFELNDGYLVSFYWEICVKFLPFDIDNSSDLIIVDYYPIMVVL